MQREPNQVRQKLAAGRRVAGSVLYSWSPNVMEVAGLAGLDFVRIDTEHAWRQDASLEHMLRAAAIADVVAIVRVDRDQPHLIRKVLEIGAGGVLLPNVSSEDEVKRIVRAAKFPPRGNRGYSGQCWSGGWGARAGEKWIQWSNTEPLIGVMIENVDAINHVDQILAVEGLDFALFGPADYSMSLGLGKPDREDARVRDALERTLVAARNAGKHVMYNPGADPVEVSRCIAMGVTMVELSSDLGLIHSAWVSARDSVREPLP